jgi:hypothetical protein
MLWMLEEVNPVFELRSPAPELAGLCAYMWDAISAIVRHTRTDGATRCTALQTNRRISLSMR